MAKVVLIEDEELLREMLVDELTSQGHDVVQAENGEVGLEKILESSPEIILCDRAMPGMSGFDLLEKLRSEYPQYNETPFVFLTALTDPRDKAAVEHLGAAAYIEKPVDFNVLQEKIESLVKVA